MPKVSVIIPCYNHSNFLPDAVASVINQSFSDYEIIIINDGSTDNTEEVAEGLLKNYPDKVRLINQENHGVSVARNVGITQALGIYYLPLDADDLLLPECLEKLITILEKNKNLDFVYSWSARFGLESGIDRRGEFSRMVLLKNEGPHPTALIKKSEWKRVGGYKSIMFEGYEDWEFYISLFEIGSNGGMIPEVLFKYRKHGPSRADQANRLILRVMRKIKLLHPCMFEPTLSRISVRLAKAVIWLKSCTRDPISHFIYIKFPLFHKCLRDFKYGIMERRAER